MRIGFYPAAPWCRSLILSQQGVIKLPFSGRRETLNHQNGAEGNSLQ
jgi:hypothetical protein